MKKSRLQPLATAVLLALALLAPGARPASALTVNATGAQAPRDVRPGEASAALFQLDLAGFLTSTQLRTVTFTNHTTGLGATAELDLELGTLRLYRDDGDGAFEPAADPVVGTATASSGQIRFTGLSVTVPGNGSVRLFLAAGVSLAAHDGDALDVSVNASSDLTFQPSAIVTGTFPIDPAGNFPVDGMSAAQIALHALPAAPLVAGQSDRLVFDGTLPANGYATDRLERLEWVQLGTAVTGTDVAAMRAWRDDGDGVFEPGADAALGPLVSVGGGRWVLTGLTENVPLAGVRVFVSADLGLFARDGRTVRLSLPTLPAPGVSMQSDNDGPNDLSVQPASDLTITTLDRVTLTSAAVTPVVARPGDTGAVLLHVVARNAYASPRTLTHLRAENATRGSGTTSELDHELSRVALRADGNGDGVLGTPAQDPEIAAGVFAGGRIDFNGLALSLPSGQDVHLFVVGDVSTGLAGDGDSLSARMLDPADVALAESSFVVAPWPLDSGARVAVDGMVAAQIGQGAVASRTLGPSEGPAAALSVLVPPDGYRSDTLTRFRVSLAGTAQPSDLAQVRWWRDGGDGRFTGADDDLDLGVLSWNGSAYERSGATEAVGAGGTRFFVSVMLSASPTDGATVRLAIPVNGLTMTSANDGPIDQLVVATATHLISNAPLTASLVTVPGTSVIGGTAEARLAVRNRIGERITGIAPGPLGRTGNGRLTVIAGPTPPTIDLDPGASDTLVWTLRADSAGSVTLSAGASGTGQTSGWTRSSVVASAPPHAIYAPAAWAEATPTSSMPAGVTRGQANVAPLSFTLRHPGAAGAAPIRLRGIRIGLEDANGAGIVPAQLLSRVAVESGAGTLAARDTLETSGATVDLPLSPAPVLGPGESLPVTVRVDVSSSTTASDFRVVLADSTSFDAVEDPTERALGVRLTAAAYPFRTTLARIVAPATELRFAAATTAPGRASRGQTAVPLLSLSLENPGITGVTSDARLFALPVRVARAVNGAALRLVDVLTTLRLRSGAQSWPPRTVYPIDDSTVVLALNPALVVPAGSAITLDVEGNLAATAPLDSVRAQVPDSLAVDARDAQTGESIPARLASTPLVCGVLRIEAPADTLLARGTALFAARTRIGDQGVPALSLTLRHPGDAWTGRIAVGSIVVQCRDERRQDVAPAAVFDRATLVGPAGPIASTTALPASGGSFSLSFPTLTLEPGDSVALELRVDVDPRAPQGFLELTVAAGGIAASEANLGTAVAVAPDASAELPAASGLTHLEPPASELAVALESRMPPVLSPDGRAVVAGVLRLRNPAAGSDTIYLERLVLRAARRDRSVQPLGAGAASVEAWVANALWAATAPLTPDSASASLVPAAALAVPPGATVPVELRFHTVTASPPADLRLSADSAAVEPRQPASAVLRIQVRPEAGGAFPLETEAGRFEAADFAASLSTFPNPFAAGREAATFVYYLRAGARVSVRLSTLDGEPVRTLLDRSPRAAGLQQHDAWDGRNGAGRLVRNGVYLAEIVSEFDDGGRERVVRKVAVLR